MTTSKKILFIGNERLATGVTTSLPVLKSLVKDGYDIRAILTTAAETRSGSRKPRPLEIAEYANEHNIPLLTPESLKDFAKELSSYGAEAAVLAAYGKMVPSSIISLFPKGIINIHPSILPKHRGPTPIESTILDGDASTGVSLMQLAPAMDAGPVFAQIEIKLSGNESKQELVDRLGVLGASMLVDLLPDILSGNLTPKAQEDNHATYDQKISATDSVLDFNKSAEQLEREVRAFSGWPRSRTVYNKIPLIITEAHVKAGQGEPGKLFLEGDGFGWHAKEGILVIDRLIPAGSKEMTAAEFRRGYIS